MNNSLVKVKEEFMKDSSSKEEFVERMIRLFKSDSLLFHQYLFGIFFEKLSIIIKDELQLSDLKLDDKVNDLMPKSYRKQLLMKLQEASDFLMPRPVMSNITFFILFILVFIPVVLILIISLKFPVIFIASFEIVLAGGIVVIFSLVILVRFIFPELLSSNDLPRVYDFRDFVQEVVKLNEYLYRINNYKLTVDALIEDYLEWCLYNNFTLSDPD